MKCGDYLSFNKEELYERGSSQKFYHIKKRKGGTEVREGESATPQRGTPKKGKMH